MFLAGRVVKFHVTAGEFHEFYAGGYKALGQLGKLIKGEPGYATMSMSRISKGRDRGRQRLVPNLSWKDIIGFVDVKASL